VRRAKARGLERKVFIGTKTEVMLPHPAKKPHHQRHSDGASPLDGKSSPDGRVEPPTGICCGHPWGEPGLLRQVAPRDSVPTERNPPIAVCRFRVGHAGDGQQRPSRTPARSSSRSSSSSLSSSSSSYSYSSSLLVLLLVLRPSTRPREDHAGGAETTQAPPRSPRCRCRKTLPINTQPPLANPLLPHLEPMKTAHRYLPPHAPPRTRRPARRDRRDPRRPPADPLATPTRTPAAALDATRLAAAVRSYADTLRTEGKTVPTSVSLDQLIARGLLAPDDVSLFAGLEVTLNPAADESRPQDLLAQVRFPDGAVVAALADGSIQQRPR
jgi:hypothetical protein